MIIWAVTLANLIIFYDEMTHLIDEGKAVNVVYLNFSTAFNTVFHSILEKLAAHCLEKYSLVKNCLTAKAQRVHVNEV